MSRALHSTANRTAARIAIRASRLAVCAAALFSAQAESHLDPARPISQLRHDVWGTEEGLPQNTVPAIVQTNDGYLWLGTELGLARFDGLHFTVFDRRNTPELKSNAIYALLEDRQGALWIGTNGGGLTRFRDGKFQSYGAREGLAGSVVLCLHEDRSGVLWVGTDGGGLNRFSEGRFTVYDTKQGLGDNAVFAIAEEPGGTLWIGTHGGLSRFSQGRFTNYTARDGLPADYVRCLHAARAGGLWIGTNGGGLGRLQDGTFTTYRKQDGLAGNSISSLLEDDRGSLWIGTVGTGLSRFAEGRFVSFGSREGLSNEDVWSLYQDRSGSLWIGTGGGGLNRLESGRFTAYDTTEGLSSDMVLPVYEDHEGAIWMGTNGGGLNRYREGKFTRFTTKDGLADDLIFTVYEDRPGSLWVGTRKGLNHLENGKFKLYTTRDGLPSDKVLVSYVDRHGVLWVGGRGGLSRFQDGRFTTYTAKDGMSTNYVLAIREDHQGALWVGTGGGGLNRLKDGRFTVFNSTQGLTNAVVWAIYEDIEGVLWVGTNGGGLNRLKDGRFTGYTTGEGMFDDAIFQILEDGAGNLWMSCNKGIFRASKRQLNDLAEGKTRAIDTVSYGVADGMRSRECNGGFQPAGWKSRDGRMWFPTMKGVVVFNPEQVGTGASALPVIIEQALIDRRVARPSVQAPPGSGELEFRYAAIGFHSPQKIAFKYRLDGFDRDWVDAGPRRTAYYTNTPPGSYRFRVIARDAEGHWNTTGASFQFSLAPRFYQTAWFSAMCILGVLGLAAAAHWVRVRRLHDSERLLARRVEERTAELREEIAERERVERDLVKAKEAAEQGSRVKSEFLANMSHEIRTPMNGVLGMTELTLGTDITAEQRDYLTMARSSAESLLTIINDILDFSKIEAGKMDLDPIDFELWPMLEEAVRSVAFRAGQKGLEIACDFRPGVPEAVRGDSTRLRQIVLNLLGNALKFTERGEVVLSVDCEGRDELSFELHFSVRDTGIGIPPDKQKVIFEAFSQADGSTTRKFGGTGLGLAISSRLVHMMGGRIWVNSQLGEGSEFHFTVRLGVAPTVAKPVPMDTTGLAGSRVLVVDDNHTNRRILAEVLGRWGMCTVLAESGQAALEALRKARDREEPFGLVLLDVNMPGMDGFMVLETAGRAGNLAGAKTLMLSSGGQSGDAARCRDLGGAAYLTKPVRQYELREAVLRALGRTSAAGPVRGAARDSALLGRVARPLRILLAEDNLINQQVAFRALQKRGHSIIVAGNGREALDALERESFDVVLMDVQMPVMDGFEATAAIREREKAAGTHVPIIAMTAHAMKGDEEMCLRAGMDGYIPKPIRPLQLFQTIEDMASPNRLAPV